MRIIHGPSGKVISERAVLCRSLLSKARGLMFRARHKDLVFEFKKEKIVGIHMLFVFFPIDLLFLDSNMKVAEIKENLKPFSFYTPKNKARLVIELKKGKVGENSVRLKDEIKLKS